MAAVVAIVGVVLVAGLLITLLSEEPGPSDVRSPEGPPVDPDDQRTPGAPDDDVPEPPAEEPVGLRDGLGGTSRPSGEEFRIPRGFPDGTSTGIAVADVGDGDFEEVGHLTVTDDGAVVEGVRAESIRVAADDVVIRDSVIEGASTYALDAVTQGQRGLVVERVDVHQTDPCRKAIYAQDAELRKVNAWGGDTVAVLGSNVVVRDSFLHDTKRSPACPERHYDVVHTQGGMGLHIINSTLLGPWEGQTSALIAQSNQSELQDLRLEGSFVSGGSFSVYVRERNHGVPSSVRIADNVWQDGSWLHGPTSLDRGSGWTWTGNQTTTGRPVQ